jgi:hypothetical protein
VQAGGAQTLCRMADAVKLALAGREPQTQVVMSRLAEEDSALKSGRSHFCSGRQGTTGTGSHEQPGRGMLLRRKPDALILALANSEPQTQAVMSKPAEVDFAQEATRCQVGSGRQGTADAGSHKQVGRGRLCAESHTHSSWLWQVGNRRHIQA